MRARVPLVLLAAVEELDVTQRLVDAFDGAEVCHRLDASSGHRTLQAPSACSNAMKASPPNSTKRTSCTAVSAFFTVSIATYAASSSG